MTVRLKVDCPLCAFSHFIKSDSDMKPDFSEVLAPEVPGIYFVSVTSGGRANIQNHLEPVQKFHGGNGSSEEIEYAILKHLKERADEVSLLLELKLAEL